LFKALFATLQFRGPADRLQAFATATCGGAEILAARLRKLLDLEDGPEAMAEVENYWRRVDSNLRSAELRLLFVADELPRELRRIIEFLNEHMPRIEGLGVEVREFAGRQMRKPN
jgi:hypothetical protein